MRLGDFLRIDLDDFGSVFVVYEDASFAIHRGEFGFAAERQGARNRAVRRIDGRGIFSAAIKREHALADRIVDNGVWVRVGLHIADWLQCL